MEWVERPVKWARLHAWRHWFDQGGCSICPSISISCRRIRLLNYRIFSWTSFLCSIGLESLILCVFHNVFSLHLRIFVGFQPVYRSDSVDEFGIGCCLAIGDAITTYIRFCTWIGQAGRFLIRTLNGLFGTTSMTSLQKCTVLSFVIFRCL